MNAIDLVRAYIQDNKRENLLGRLVERNRWKTALEAGL